MAISATTLSALSQPIDLSKVSSTGKQNYERFFELTENDQIGNYAEGTKLHELTELASTVRNVIYVYSRMHINADSRTQDQWNLNQLSAIKERLAKAIVMKQSYYEKSFCGIVTKYFLMLFCMWKEGTSADIIEAEDFLLMFDSRLPVLKISYPENHPYLGKYFAHRFETTGLDTSNFYNYTPVRQIELASGEKINYATL